MRHDFIFVFVAGTRAGHEDFPVAGAAHLHDMAAAVPSIEVADDADALRIRCPYDKSNAGNAFHIHRMCTELVVQLQVIALAEQIEVELRQDRRNAMDLIHDAITPC